MVVFKSSEALQWMVHTLLTYVTWKTVSLSPAAFGTGAKNAVWFLLLITMGKFTVLHLRTREFSSYEDAAEAPQQNRDLLSSLSASDNKR
jgi:hypothetical protein